jgi:hypothetical protein
VFVKKKTELILMSCASVNLKTMEVSTKLPGIFMKTWHAGGLPGCEVRKLLIMSINDPDSYRYLQGDRSLVYRLNRKETKHEKNSFSV